MASPTQTASNAQLNKSLDAPLLATVCIYLSGLVAVLLLMVFAREGFPGSGTLAKVPWWAWFGGVISIGSTIAGLTFAQKMGSGVYTGLTVTFALITSMVLDHFGLMGFKAHPASVLRLAGGALMITGLWLIAKF